ncbi:hypothetical protein [Azonexus sp. IMCC34839]|uniref:hypothetical protein n=1 Tax=Azonexus sp. IMCC34839 TaxID=3133695 RepID=UPI00399B23A8
MYRVVTQYRDQGSSRPVKEYGPWHDSRPNAEHWAEVLRGMGYVVEIQSQGSGAMAEQDDNHMLAAALANMA